MHRVIVNEQFGSAHGFGLPLESPNKFMTGLSLEDYIMLGLCPKNNQITYQDHTTTVQLINCNA